MLCVGKYFFLLHFVLRRWIERLSQDFLEAVREQNPPCRRCSWWPSVTIPYAWESLGFLVSSLDSYIFLFRVFYTSVAPMSPRNKCGCPWTNWSTIVCAINNGVNPPKFITLECTKSLNISQVLSEFICVIVYSNCSALLRVINYLEKIYNGNRKMKTYDINPI